jgi:uncharacterized membrane-anchored protein YitT (DUF2179 family)
MLKAVMQNLHGRFLFNYFLIFSRQTTAMQSYFKKVVMDAALRKTHKHHHHIPFRRAKAFRQYKITINAFARDVFLMLVGVVCAGIGLEGFLLPSKFIDGGVTGISLLLAEKTAPTLSFYLVVINAPFVFLGYKLLGRTFAIKAAISITLLALFTAFVHVPEVTNDKLLVAVFGGFFLGAGIGLSVRGGTVLDGTEVLAIFLSRKLGITMGDVIILFNVVIFAVAAKLLSVEAALYSMITYLAASKTVDFVIEGIEEYTGVTIISSHAEEVKGMISNYMKRGFTVYKGKQGFGKHGATADVDIIYTVITRLEISKINTELQKIDSNAFVVMTSIKDTKGGMIKHRRLH